MNCIRCGAEMNSTTGGNYTCQKCGMEVNDLVYRPQNCDRTLPQDFGKKEGWICPVCGRGLAPWVDCCPCQIDRNITWATGTGTGTYTNLDCKEFDKYATTNKSGWVHLPCKVGDQVFVVYGDEVQHTSVYSMKIESKDNHFVFIIKCMVAQGGARFEKFMFGKTVFLTREEAEKALEDMRKEDEGK